MAFVATALLVHPAAASTVPSVEDFDRGLGIALVGGPPNAADDVGAGRAIYDAVEPGTKGTWQLRVTNDTPDALTVSLFVVDARLGENGLDLDDERSTGPLSTWVTLRPSLLELEPRASTVVSADISPPPGIPATELLGAIVAEPPAQDEGSVGVVRRVAVPIYVASGAVLAQPDFVIQTMTAGRGGEGGPFVDVVVSNTGERILNLAGLLTLSNGPAGLATEPVLSSNTVPVDIGDEGVLRFLLDPALPAGPWDAEARISGGNLERIATATLTFPDGAGVNAEPLDVEPTQLNPDRRVLLPLAAILILLAIAALYLMLLWKRREQEEDDEDEPAAVGATSAAGEDEGS